MSENLPISNTELQFQAKEAMRVASRSVHEGFGATHDMGGLWRKEEIVASSILASTMLRLIAEGSLQRFPLEPGQTDSARQE